MSARGVETLAVTEGESGSSLLRAGQILLPLAALVVGLAIIGEGPLSRALNGVGAVLWVAATVLLVWSLRPEPRVSVLLPVAAVAAIVLGILVRPGDLSAAVIGFALAGATIGLLAESRALGWAFLVPAIYLPVHLLVAIGRSILSGGTTFRTEPPPTAPLVPLAMVVAAGLAGMVVFWLRRRD